MSTTYTVGVKIEGNAAGLARAAKQALADTKMLGQGMGQEFSKMAKAREQLGIRPEKEIQREIYRTEAAYNRLARSGTMSFNEQRRAAKAMRDEVTALTNEMGKLTLKQKAMRGLAVGGAVAGAGALGYAYAAPKVRTAMDYDVRLAHMANTAFSERGKGGRKDGMRELDAMVLDAVKYGGGTRDGALDTAEALLGSGVFKPQQVKSILREAQLAATANNADPAAFAQMAITASQTMGIKPEQMGRMFGMGTFAGQSGGFEIKDMAKWLPEQMAAAKSVGMYGEAGFAKLAALNQASVMTAGTKDKAGNNVMNLLGKIGSQDTNKDFKKLGIDLPKQLAEGRMKGMDALDVVGGLLDKQLAKDKNYQRVQKELAAAKDDGERRKALGAVGDIAQGTVIGKVFQDREALMALFAFMNGRSRVTDITKGALDNPDAALKNHELIKETASAQTQALAMAQAAAAQATMDKFLPAIGSAATGLTGLMEKYPGYTTAVVAATAAVGALAGAAGLAALALGGKSVPGLPGPGGAGPAGKGPGGAMSKMGSFLGAAAKLAGPLGFMMAVDEDDIARLRAYETRKGRDGGGSGARGQGFNDPRIIGSGDTAAALQASFAQSQVKGEIFVTVRAAPGLQVETTMQSSNARIPMKSALGITNLNAGQ
jgi:Phage-related minor tail protein